ncbi:hypothetical protein BDW02DRAFT_576364 [Decorospora gaudefroyi]|uniref:Uncharacterized protein n=1 Tax=Decorospora gaudefroyi TaxID=184978 RepID=A0A6A5KXM0_9PLEO|nr:hypothetical protein BDW02DRAFT_576364 [Decorospora gaudefroyi]
MRLIVGRAPHLSLPSQPLTHVNLAAGRRAVAAALLFWLAGLPPGQLVGGGDAPSTPFSPSTLEPRCRLSAAHSATVQHAAMPPPCFTPMLIIGKNSQPAGHWLPQMRNICQF